MYNKQRVIEHALAGIPIDMVGGTSMGSFVGAAYADSGDVTKMCQKVREWSLVRACNACVCFSPLQYVASEQAHLFGVSCKYLLSRSRRLTNRGSAAKIPARDPRKVILLAGYICSTLYTDTPRRHIPASHLAIYHQRIS